jgi:prepilin-type N-terminal cleavage/methylation domain-containing protein
MKNRGQSGFTLVELLLVMGIFVVIMGFTAPVALDFLTRTDLSTSRDQAKSAIRRAFQRARSSEGDSAWGVRVQPSKITIYKGNNFATRDQAYDEVSSISPTINFSGITDISFQKMSGTPSTTGNLSLSSSAGTRTLSINSEGRVSE